VSRPVGADVARRYYTEVVRPLLERHEPGLPHAAGRLGTGSDVLGLDDPTSRDHDWGLRLTLLVDEPLVTAVDELLERELPATVGGLPVRFATTWDPRVRHQVKVTTVEAFVQSRLGVDASAPLTVEQWLAVTGQAVLEVTAGPVFADTDGRLSAVRERLAWYPHDLWLHLVAVDWARLGEELPFVGRTGARGDDLGSRLVAARLAGVLVHLAFLLERRWPPYAKWRAAVGVGLPEAGPALRHLSAALEADTWTEREEALCVAAELLFEVQRRAGLPADPTRPAVEPFHDRPFRGVAPHVEDMLLAAVTDPRVRGLPRGVGSVEQWSDNVRVLMTPALRRPPAAR
jgi:hypothetical protein